MTDRERILTHLIQVLMLHSGEIEKTYMRKHENFKEGDILFANTSFKPHNFIVSRFVHYDESRDCYVVRDLVTGKLCDYWNESFTVINSKWINKYELLVGKQYKIYDCCCKHGGRFHSLEFNKDGTFTFRNREPFETDPFLEITLPCELAIKDIKNKLLDGSNWKECKNEQHQN